MATYTCGHCPRADFDSFEELRKHVADDCGLDDADDGDGHAPVLVPDGGHDLDCPDCGLRTPRLARVLTSDGHHVCPDCGYIYQTYTAFREPGDHVLVHYRYRSNHSTYHLASEDDPLVPACREVFRQPDADYKPVSKSRLADQYTLCNHCDPDHEVVRGTTGERLHAELSNLDPEDVPELQAGGDA